MRIDLIPDAPKQPVSGTKRRVVVAKPAAPAQRKEPAGAGEESSRYEELFQSVYDGALITDLSGHIMDANARAIEFLRYTRDEMRDLTIFDVISGSDESLIRTLWENLEEERFTLIQAHCVRKDGTYFPSEIAVNKLRLGEVRLGFFVRDITVRRQAEEMLRTEHNAIQNAGNGIAVANDEALLEYVNPAVAAMWGYARPDDMLGADVHILFADRAVSDAMVAAVRDTDHAWMGECVARRNDGGEFHVQVSAACNRNSDGEPVGIVLSLVNINDRKRAESAERESERQRVMLESLGAACHHLGQPATVLLANLGIIQKRLAETDPATVDLVTASISAARSLGAILHKLNAVREYQTMQYLGAPEGSDMEENRILKI
ncbi:MAG: PAS domain S-box protein [Lentisphaerae bacterium]|nr:PAS domain S-box protein [Lentisphaerota bacterium]